MKIESTPSTSGATDLHRNAASSQAVAALPPHATPTSAPHEATAATVPSPSTSLDWGKIGKNAAVDGFSLLSTFGATGVASALLRANPKISPALKVMASGVQPIIGAAASAYSGERLRELTNTRPTEHSKYKPLQDASTPLGFMAASEVFGKKFAPMLTPLAQLTGPTKVAAAFAGPAFAALGSTTGSAIRETTAQKFAHTSEPTDSGHPTPSVHAQAIGRGITQLPASLVTKSVALQAIAGLPAAAAPWVPRAVGAGFSLRNHTTPNESKKSES